MHCLDKDADTRWSAEELLEHSWLKGMTDENAVANDELLEIGQNFMDFKRTTLF